MNDRFELRIVDGCALRSEPRALLRPGEAMQSRSGETHLLPRFFFEVESWERAKQTKLSPHFRLAELMAVDCREAGLLLKSFPHHVPCAVSILSHYLEEFRQRVDAPVFVSVNGGYRSPAHRLSAGASAHNWATAADIYRVGDTYLDNQKDVEKYGRIAESIGSEVFVKPYGHGEGETDDHLHFEIGFVTLVPRGCDEGRGEGQGG